MEKIICFTLDLERDYGWLKSYNALKNIDPLLNFFEEQNLKLSVFISGEIIDKYPSEIKKLKDFGCDFGVHSYYHNLREQGTPQKIYLEVEKARKSFIKFFNFEPENYRFPQGFFTKEDLNILKEFGFKNDFSIFPFWRPGMFNNLIYPVEPFKYKNGILEFPFAVTPILRFPISLSYIQFLGWRPYKIIMSLLGLPKILIFNFHLHNLDKSEDRKKLPLLQKIFYSHNQDKGFKILDNFIKYISARGYHSINITELTERISQKFK